MGFTEIQIRRAFQDLKKTETAASVESMVSRLVEKEFYTDSDAETPQELSSALGDHDTIVFKLSDSKFNSAI